MKNIEEIDTVARHIHTSTLKDKNGITLIALIITIIVLLILAGVSIALVLGDNGILFKAQRAKSQSVIGDVRDTAEIIRGEYEVDNNGENPTAMYIIEGLINKGKIKRYQVRDWGETNGIGIINVEGEDVLITGSFNGEDMVPGLYETGTLNLKKSWADLKADGDITVGDTLYRYETRETDSSGITHVSNNEILLSRMLELGYNDIDSYISSHYENYTITEIIDPTGLIVKQKGLNGDLRLSREVKVIDDDCFHSCNNLTAVIIPDSVEKINKFAFEYCKGLTSIEIPDSVTNIGYCAFYQCSNLTSIKLSNNLVRLESQALAYTKISNIELPNTLEYIGQDAFCECTNLTEITIPDSVAQVGAWAFRNNTSLERVYIGKGLINNIHSQTFIGCKNLSYIEVSTENPRYDSRNNCNAIVETEINKLIIASNNTIIPDDITAIGGQAFQATNISSITVPEGVTSIGTWAFGYNSLTYILLPNSISTFDTYPFYGAKKISKIYFNGTKSEWNSKGFSAYNIKTGSTITKVVCSDGEITL